ncbi:hypothetical protein B1992_13875 [Pseudoxanthomonas broegbernensis]|uniref:Uncharacterized protein n=1 Tax=Pseudoxanthomonas broegbernensis TaxID=83619 RepID=A0A7V8GKD2_9GAMM|nr:hypothetical protein [Pseudoxanthomonas broegbernensis]KAF1684916.1 hypothetical protein B1992_13875 [Pseudoxanthomonas broegbernensis]MBB6066286.1 hypothetical protein [Pseudoxanthomonas broegbernensis]
MEFKIRIGNPRIDGIEHHLLQLDPAGLVDVDAADGRVRIATCAQPFELAMILAAAGHPVAVSDIELMPSVCCGGCSG